MKVIKTQRELINHVHRKFSSVIKGTAESEDDTEDYLIFKTDQDAMDAFNYLIETKLPEGVCGCSLSDLSVTEPVVAFER